MAIAIALGVGLWLLMTRLLFDFGGAEANLSAGTSYAVALLLFALSQFLAFRIVILGWDGARFVVVSALMSSNSLRSPLGQFALGVFVGRRRQSHGRRP